MASYGSLVLSIKIRRMKKFFEIRWLRIVIIIKLRFGLASFRGCRKVNVFLESIYVFFRRW